ncbi:MAG: hypothetical protein ACRDD8_15865 [Bacteroidales bacterium]
MRVMINEVNESMELFESILGITENVKMYLPEEDIDMEKTKKANKALKEMNFKLDSALMVARFESKDYVVLSWLEYLEYKAYRFFLNKAINKK